MLLGISPENELWLRRKICNSVKSPIHLGNIPDNLFHDRSMKCSSLHLRRKDGKLPDNLLLLNRRNFRLPTPISKHRGSSPSKRLLPRSKASKAPKLHKYPGICPLI
ncbi:hypothetical protein DAI22_11g169101 [Oryza sativa Japonica Group]|nr:hypothetical protein DAI22_11g169101 [Oryza sativa Japonica Group]